MANGKLPGMRTEGKEFRGIAASIAVGMAFVSLSLASTAFAQTAPDQPANAAAANQGEPDFWTGLFAPSRSNLLGDVGGLRTVLGNHGITFGLTETSEVLGNVSGGVRLGFEYEGLTTATLGLDTAKAFGWDGGSFDVSALQIHGRNLSADNLDDLQTASGIEANRAARLWELWYRQQFLDGQADAKIGQQSIDQEFMTSQYSSLYVNTMMGWPMIPSVDLYAGGPAYPLSSLGVRFRAEPTKSLTVLAGVFDDNPPGGPFNNDSQLRGAEASGAAFNLNTGALLIAEIQYAVNQPAVGDMAKTDQPTGLAGTYKLGAWYNTAAFPDQRSDNTGQPLARPTERPVPIMATTASMALPIKRFGSPTRRTRNRSPSSPAPWERPAIAT